MRRKGLGAKTKKGFDFETSEAMRTTWEHAKLEIQKFIKIGITQPFPNQCTDMHSGAELCKQWCSEMLNSTK